MAEWLSDNFVKRLEFAQALQKSKRLKMTQDKLEYQFKKAFWSKRKESLLTTFVKKRKIRGFAATEKIALINLQIKNCDDIIYTANIQN